MGKRTSTWGLVLVVLVAGGVALLLMSSNSEPNKPAADSSNQSNTNTKNTDESQTENQSTAQANAVAIQDYAYSPSNITVKVGTTVTWTNRDAVGHTVTVEGGEGPDSQMIDQGKTFSYTFTKAGTYNYFCKPHPYMKGVVIVTE